MVAPVAAGAATVSTTVREFRAMNTEWWIAARGCDDLAFAETLVHEAEAALSRFHPDSDLSRLNRDREATSPDLAALVRRSLELSVTTGGAFDVRVGPSLVAAGYDRSFERLAGGGTSDAVRLAPPVGMLSVTVSGDTVRLDGIGAIDLGGIAKGWTIDRIAEVLRAVGCRDFVIDGGGDIRAAGVNDDGLPWALGVGDGLAVRISDGAVCTSSVDRRRWRTATGEAHHIIDPATGASSRSLVTNAVVVARDTATADALATALIADPPRALRALEALHAEALLERAGRWEMTPGMEGTLA